MVRPKAPLDFCLKQDLSILLVAPEKGLSTIDM